MIRSMTGFGQAERQAGGIRIQVDMKSVNHRYGETVFRMPREWLIYEDKLRKLVGNRIKRGRVDVFVTAERSGAARTEAEIDWALADSYKQAAEQLGERYRISGELSLSELLALPGLVQVRGRLQTEQETEQALTHTIEEALDELISMREKEGVHLHADLKQRQRILTELVERTIAAASHAVEQIRGRLRQRLTELLQDAETGIDENRFTMEVAILAERSNIDEELTRLQSHLSQFADMLAASEPIGRKLDFLIQEMNREVNTIGSKAGQTELTNLVVDMKAELEKIREQAQNIE